MKTIEETATELERDFINGGNEIVDDVKTVEEKQTSMFTDTQEQAL